METKVEVSEQGGKDPLLALAASGSPAQWSLCPRRRPTGTLFSLHKTWKSHSSSAWVINPAWHFGKPPTLTRWDWSAGLRRHRTGRHRGVWIRGQTLGQLLELQSDGNQIRRAELPVDVLKLLNLEGERVGDTVSLESITFTVFSSHGATLLNISTLSEMDSVLNTNNKH